MSLAKHGAAIVGATLAGIVGAEAQNQLPGAPQPLPPVVTGPGGNGGCNGMPCGGGGTPTPNTPVVRPHYNSFQGNQSFQGQQSFQGSQSQQFAPTNTFQPQNTFAPTNNVAASSASTSSATSNSGGNTLINAPVTKYQAPAIAPNLASVTGRCSYTFGLVGAVGGTVSAGAQAGLPAMDCEREVGAYGVATAAAYAHNNLALQASLGIAQKFSPQVREAFVEISHNVRNCGQQDFYGGLTGNCTGRLGRVYGQASHHAPKAHKAPKRRAAPAACPTGSKRANMCVPIGS